MHRRTVHKCFEAFGRNHCTIIWKPINWSVGKSTDWCQYDADFVLQWCNCAIKALLNMIIPWCHTFDIEGGADEN